MDLQVFMLLRLDPAGPGLDRAGSGRGGRWGLKQGAWRSFLARQRKNVPTHFHRPPARPSFSAVGLLKPGINQSPETTNHLSTIYSSYYLYRQLPHGLQTVDLPRSCSSTARSRLRRAPRFDFATRNQTHLPWPRSLFAGLPGRTKHQPPGPGGCFAAREVPSETKAIRSTCSGAAVDAPVQVLAADWGLSDAKAPK